MKVLRSSKEVREAYIEVAGRTDPVFAALATRSYDMPGCASSLRTMMSIIASGIVHWDSVEAAPTFNAAHFSSVYGFPWWYIPRPVMELLRDLRPPDGLHLARGSMKFPSMWFVLPTGMLEGDEGEKIGYLNVTLINDDIVAEAIKHHKRELRRNSSQQMLQVSAWSDEGVLFHNTLPFDNHEISWEEIEQLPYAGVTGESEGNCKDSWGTKVLLPLVANLLTLMVAKPEIVEVNNSAVRRIRKTSTDVWSPRVIGRHVKRYVRSDHETVGSKEKGGGWTVKPHMRSDHWKRVWYGEGKKLWRQQLIEATPVNWHLLEKHD